MFLVRMFLAMLLAAAFAACGGDPVDNAAEQHDNLGRADCVCTTEWLPVCGIDGNTYGNPCEAGCAGVEIAHRGECSETAPILEPPVRLPEPEPDPDGCICTREWAPVCGADGRTYGNACEASCARVRIAHRGECEADPEPPVRRPDPDGEGCVCTMEWDPVCGADGRTYGNGCQASCARVRVVHRGECDPSAQRPPRGCDQQYEPVCGVDGNTYGNACEARAALVRIAHEGECGVSIDPPPRAQGCDQQYEPVCGVDGNTYGNACEARAALVRVDHEGECQAEQLRLQPSPREDCVCPHVWEPVCGVDGRTYGNGCVASCANVAVDYVGACGSYAIR